MVPADKLSCEFSERAETVSDISFKSSDPVSVYPDEIPNLDGLCPTRCIRRKLLPRRPGRDASLEQYCTLYTSTSISHDSEAQDDDYAPDTLVLTPITSEGHPLPYYHPRVVHLAFRYLEDSTGSTSDSFGILRIEIIPLPDVEFFLDPNGRIYRTCLALLDTLHRYGWGAMTNYQKRVQHDVLVSRERYQDLYLIMRERHKGLVDTWKEVTDPLKHVFEDIGIATYLILLWKDTFAVGEIEGKHGAKEKYDDEDNPQPWRQWPRPPGGFLDLGCGNGLLTHILVSEGYSGHGIDVRARTSWSSYPEATQKALHVHAFDALSEAGSHPEDSKFFRPNVFIIANHADELTPWTPVLATLYNASGYLSIPCCAWTFDARYSRSKADVFPLPQPGSGSGEQVWQSVDGFARTLALGGESTNSNLSGYSMYRIWLASLSLHCGWEVECDNLRIPSTRNWALTGRKHAPEVPQNVARENVDKIIIDVKQRGTFKARKPEGRDDGH
ncbi:hypothetical protein D9758_014800 [Tetrapyrgos nigripes]|uniref:tRNA (uracil-O(2)-)-methyltransferase n=1 Tax=Tetrapyrgos nigripes TaxID=182062 RepID=A0A8H5C5J1_9AGAR|nr:hypothetical protein D9758_014800 [Tetrapyrgos nigripes]